ncbi:PAS domain S-box protein [Methylobacterium sp. NMS14P]|uniref:PAS domain S-box protein n=1 Tax=Methylobacterium sp. NMS14P TaxID=2894310 RepID=UPI003FD1BC35
MAAHIRAFDWTATPLGSTAAWSERLKVMVEQVLASPLVTSLVCGPERVLIYNDAAAKLYGDRHPAALGHPLAETFPEGWATVAPFYARAFAGETVQIAGQPLDTRGEGEATDVFDALLTPVREADERVAFVHMTGFEIGARARVEAALRASETRHRLLIESWAQAVWETDGSGVVIADCPSWRAYTGQTLEEWLGYGWLDAIHPDDRAYAERQWREAVAVRGLVNAEFRLRAPDGGWRWTNVRAAPVLDAGGRVEKWLGMNIDIDVRKRAEAALRDSEERYRTLFESMDEAYAVVEVIRDEAHAWSDFRFLEVNPAFMQHTAMPYPVGKTATELLGTPNPRWTQMYGRALDTGLPLRVQEPEQSLGRTFDLNIFSLDRERNRVAVLFSDITERVRAEAALRASEERFRAFVTASSDVIYCMSPDWSEMWALDGRGFLADTTCPSGEWLGAYIDPADQQQVTAAIRAAIRAKTVFELEHRVRRTDGSLGWTLSRAVPLLDAAGDIREWLGTASDATARRSAEEALRRSEAQFRTLADTAPALIWRNDKNGENLFINGYFITFTGKSADAIRGEGWHTLVHPDDVDDYVADYLAAVHRRRPWQNRNRIRRYDGEWRWFENYAQPLFGEDGTYLGHIGVSTDITASVEAEAALRASEERQAFLLRLGDALRPLSDAVVIQDVACRILGAHLGVGAAQYSEIDIGRGVISNARDSYRGAMPSRVGTHDLSLYPVHAEAWRAGRSVAIDDIAADTVLSAGERHGLLAYEVRAALTTPLIKDGKVVAAMAALSSAPLAWRASDIDLLEETADRTWAAVERARAEMRLRDSEERLRQFGEASSDVLWIRDAKTLQWVYLTPAFEQIYGLDREAALRGDNLAGWLDMILPDDRPHALAAIDRVRAGERVSFEYRIRQPRGGAVRWLRNTDFPMRNAAGTLCWFGGVGRDITEEKAATRRQDVLVNELQHRARNLLGVVTAVADRTVKQGGSVEAFEERLQALSRAQALLSQAGSDTVEVGALVRAELAAHANGAWDRLTIAGPEVSLKARQVQNFALALHELTTNAVKYGALKVETGRLDVTWEVVLDRRGRRRLTLSWVESGVAIDPETTTRRGYGTELIQEALAYAMEAEVDYALGTDGVRCRIEMPIT